jgi:hypothetical protein
MRRLVLAIALLGLAACGDNNVQPPPDARPDDPDAGDDPDGGIEVVGPCLDTPADLPRPPTGQLPCDLLPPGFAL